MENEKPIVKTVPKESKSTLDLSDITQTETETDATLPPKFSTDIHLISKISETLDSIIIENRKSPNYKEIIESSKNSVFSKRHHIPHISIYDYLKRIQCYTFLENNTLILSLIYIDRLYEIGGLNITEYNIHRVLFTSILTAIKYNEDKIYSDDYYAKVAGIKPKELFTLESKFLETIQYRLFVNEEIFNNYKNYLEKFHQSYEEEEDDDRDMW